MVHGRRHDDYQRQRQKKSGTKKGKMKNGDGEIIGNFH